MEKDKKERLEAKGWKVGTVSDFLELTPEEATLIEGLATQELLTLARDGYEKAKLMYETATEIADKWENRGQEK